MPPSYLRTYFGMREWITVSPRVVRYEDQIYVDRFFKTGELRLTSFSVFAEYPDEVRGDAQEGLAVVNYCCPNNLNMIVGVGLGSDGYVLCCSHRLDDALGREFRRSSGFLITNTTAFAGEVAKKLPGYKTGLEGSCSYRKKRVINRKLGFDPRESGAAFSMFDREALFLKLREYEPQQEYRFIWAVRNADPHITIEVPDARQFCARIHEEDY